MFGIVMFFTCQIYNCCNCRSIQADSDSDDERRRKKESGDPTCWQHFCGCCEQEDEEEAEVESDEQRACKCCTPPDCAGDSSMCRAFLYILLLGSAICAICLGCYGLAESKRQAESGLRLVATVDELSDWAMAVSKDVVEIASKADSLVTATKAANSGSCARTVQAQVSTLATQVSAFKNYLVSLDATEGTLNDVSVIDGAVGGLNATVGAVFDGTGALLDTADGLLAGAVIDLKSLIVSCGGQMKSIQNFTTNFIVKYENRREMYVKNSLAGVVGLVLLTIVFGLLAACTDRLKGNCCTCMLGWWSFFVIISMLAFFVLSGTLLLFITFWADFCFDNVGALMSVLSTKDLAYDTVAYYAHCPGYDAAQREADFPFSEYVTPAKEMFDLAAETIKTLVSAVSILNVNSKDSKACTAEIDTIQAHFLSIQTDIFAASGPDYGLFTADGPLGCAQLNAHLNSVLTLTCDDMYVPLTRGFEFLFIIGWLLIFTELATKCLKVAADGNDDFGRNHAAPVLPAGVGGRGVRGVREVREVRGICFYCGETVYNDQFRDQDQHGKYFHTDANDCTALEKLLELAKRKPTPLQGNQAAVDS